MNDFIYDYDYGDDYFDVSFQDYNTYVPNDVNLEESFANLSSWQWQEIENYTLTGQLCLLEQWHTPPPKGPYCNATWDSFKCWPATPANTTVELPCPNNFQDAKAFRECGEDGEWKHGNWTNYTVCFALAMPHLWEIQQQNEQFLQRQQDQETMQWIAKIVAHIYFYGGLFSSILLSVTFFIFSYFKTIQCNRISIHKHLVMSFIIRSVLFVILFEPFVYDPIRKNSYIIVDWLCKGLTALLQYATMANIFWMFVEGLFLHNRVAVSVFNREAPFKIFYFLGWGLPGLIVTSWVVVMHLYNTDQCWIGYFSMPHMWIIVLPITIALSVSNKLLLVLLQAPCVVLTFLICLLDLQRITNAVFLINIIRILITKLRANKTMETEQVRKAVKATAVLFPLLGMTNVCFFIEPHSRESVLAYRVSNAALQSVQGMFVSVIYCFMNSEVKIAMMKKYRRYQAARPDFIRGRGRNSRSSSIYVTSSDKGINVLKKRDSKDSASSKRGSQDSSMKRKDSQETSSTRKRSSQDMGGRKRGSQESKSRSPIEESPEHEPSVAVIAEEVKDVENVSEDDQENSNNTSKRVRFFSISLKLSPDNGRKKLRNGTPPVTKKTDKVTLSVSVEPTQDVLGHRKNDETGEIDNENNERVNEGQNKNELIITMPVTDV